MMLSHLSHLQYQIAIGCTVYKNRNLFLTVLKTEKSKIKAQLLCSENSPSGLYMTVSHCSLMCLTFPPALFFKDLSFIYLLGIHEARTSCSITIMFGWQTSMSYAMVHKFHQFQHKSLLILTCYINYKQFSSERIQAKGQFVTL